MKEKTPTMTTKKEVKSSITTRGGNVSAPGRKEVIKMKRKLIIIALALGLINVGGSSLLSQAHAAHLKSYTNHSQIHAAHLKSPNHKPVLKSNNVRKTSDAKKETENGSASEDENLPGGGHADTDGENVDHQFEGVE